MDGLLIDSEVLWHKAEVEIFGALGVPLFESEIRSTKGMYVNEVVDYWYARYPWNAPSNDEVVDMLLERVGALVESEGRLLPGAIRALDLTSARGPIALASSTPLSLIRRCSRSLRPGRPIRLDSFGRVRALRQAAPRRSSSAPRPRSASRRRAVSSSKTPPPGSSPRAPRACASSRSRRRKTAARSSSCWLIWCWTRSRNSATWLDEQFA